MKQTIDVLFTPSTEDFRVAFLVKNIIAIEVVLLNYIK